MHPRQLIRDTVVSAVTSLSTTGSRVTANRLDPFRSLPALNVVTLNEEVRDDYSCMGGNGDEFRELRLIVEGRAQSASDVYDVLDTIVGEVDEAVLKSMAIRALVADITMQSTAFGMNRDGSIPTGMVEMVFSILYQI